MRIPPLDTLVDDVDVVTLDPDRPRARRVGILHGRIVGLDEEVADWPAREHVDGRGGCLLPGLVDAHTHLQLTGQALASVRIDECSSVHGALAVIEQAARSATSQSWIEVAGYDQRRLGRHLTASELDAAAGGRRVWVKHVSSHASVVSTAVLDRAPGGVRSDGLLEELDQQVVFEQRMPYSEAELAIIVETAARAAAREGVTTCIEAGAGGEVGSLSVVDAAIFQHLAESDRLPVRTRLMPSMDVLHRIETHGEDGFGRAIDLGMRTGFGSGMVGLSAQKVVLDGGMSVGTARMTEPMRGSTRHGTWRRPPEEMSDAIVDGHIAGWQMAVHAIGDEAVDLALAAFEEAHRRRPRSDARHRIEHGGAIRPDQVGRIAALGVAVVSQPSFLHAFGDAYVDLLGPDRSGWLYRGRSLLDQGVRLVGSTDRPLPGTPLQAIQSWVDRTSSGGLVIEAQDRLTVTEAIETFTVHAAWVMGAEHELGRVRPGYLADLTLLGEDPSAVDVGEIADIDVLATFVEGRCTWHGGA